MKVIEVIKEDPEKAIGLKVTSFIEQTSITKSEGRLTPEDARKILPLELSDSLYSHSPVNFLMVLVKVGVIFRATYQKVFNNFFIVNY